MAVMRLKMIQYPCGRHYEYSKECQYAKDHPLCLEPSYNCAALNCKTCLGVRYTREFVNECYAAQHRVCQMEEIQGEICNSKYSLFHHRFSGLISRARRVLQFIIDHRLDSIMFMKRRSTNTRGSPVRAAVFWCLLEEGRCAVENRFNLNMHSNRRPLRELVYTFIGMDIHLHENIFNLLYLDRHAVLDADFGPHIVEPIMPVNRLWRQPVVDDIYEVGMLLEVQVIGCRNEMLPFGRIWWPLCAAMMSRTMNVSI